MQKDLSSVHAYVFIYPSGGIPELAEDPSLTTVVGGKKPKPMSEQTKLKTENNKKKNNNYDCDNNKRQYMDVTAAGILAPGHVYSTQTTRMNPYTFFFLLDYNIWPAKALEMSKCFPSATTTPTTTSSAISRPRVGILVYVLCICIHSTYNGEREDKGGCF